MIISDTLVSSAGDAYGRGAYKKTASIKPLPASAKKSAPNTDKIEFSSSAEKSDADGRILPERYKESSMAGKFYYKGSAVTEYELLETAVKTGAIELDESQTTGYNSHKAMEALIYSKASPAYPWSSTLYSEDGMYVFRVEGGQITGMSKAWFDGGTTFLDVAKDLASGLRPCDIDPCKLSWFSSNDPELFKAACEIGSAKRSYIQETAEYNEGHLTKAQYQNEMYPLFLLFFGKSADVLDPNQHEALKHFFAREDFAQTALENYGHPDNNETLRALLSGRERGMAELRK